MIGQLTPPPAIPALYEFRLLLELLSDADKYNAKLNDLALSHERAAAMAETANLAVANAVQAKKEFQDTYEVNRRAASDVADREAAVAARENDLSRKSKAYEDMCVERDAGYRTRVKELDAREAELRDREANIAAKQAKADNAQAHASALIGEYEAKLSQLKALVK